MGHDVPRGAEKTNTTEKKNDVNEPGRIRARNASETSQRQQRGSQTGSMPPVGIRGDSGIMSGHEPAFVRAP